MHNCVLVFGLGTKTHWKSSNLPSFAAINAEGKEIFLRDIWPTREETQAIEKTFVIPSMFKEVYEKIEVL